MPRIFIVFSQVLLPSLLLGCGDTVTWDGKVNIVSVLSLLVNVGLVAAAHVYLQRQKTRENYAIETLTRDLRAIATGAADLHERVLVSRVGPLSRDECLKWLIDHRRVSNQLNDLRVESKAWGLPASAVTRCEEAEKIWREYKAAVTSVGFPTDGFSITEKKLKHADDAERSLRPKLGEYRRLLVK